MRTFLIENFGCRASQADGAALEVQLCNSGIQPASSPAHSDLLVLNTCTVTASADADVRSAIRRAQTANPQVNILVTGCYAQRAPEELSRIPGVKWIVGNSHKALISDILCEQPYHTAPWDAFSHQVPALYHGDPSSSFLSPAITAAQSDRARPNLKIQDGCNNRCSFCIIPAVRGASRFSPAETVIRQIDGLSQRYCEVVLTGINLGRWGRESGSNLRLVDLLRRVLDETAIARVRLSSVEPMDWSDDLIALIAASRGRIAPHVHMPLQSGSDRILRAMYRKYRPRHYADRLLKAFAAIPDAAIGADVMTGFPGETDVCFEESRRFIEGLPFTYLHVFTYSERPGTKAADLAGVVPIHVRRERTAILREISARMNRVFRTRMIGRKLSAVTLARTGLALTGNYIHVQTEAWDGPQHMLSVQPEALTPAGMREAIALPVLS